MRRIPASFFPLLAVLSWGAMFPIADHAFSHVDPFNITAVRYGVASLLFLALLVLREGPQALAPEGRGRSLFLLGSLGFAGFNLLAYVGVALTDPQNVAIIVPTMPLVTVLVRWWRDGIRPAPAMVGSIALALIGVLLVVTRGDLSTLSGGAGDLLVVVAVTCWVLYTLGAARFPGWSTLRYTALSATAGTGTILAATAVADLAGWQRLPSGSDLVAAWPEIAFIVLFGAVAAVLAWNHGVRLLGPANTSLFIVLVPVTTFAVRIAGGYRPVPVELAGVLLVLVAVVGANLAGRRPAEVAENPLVSERSLT